MRVNFYSQRYYTPVFQAKNKKNDVQDENINSAGKPQITDADRAYFRDYMISKQIAINTTKEEIEGLFEYDDAEFVYRANTYIADKLGIPKNLQPEVSGDPLDKVKLMKYDPTCNCIIIGRDLYNILLTPTDYSDIDNMKKMIIFVNLRKSLQDCVNVFNVLRHETLYKNAIEFYSNQGSLESFDLIDKMSEIMSKDDCPYRFNIDNKGLNKFYFLVNGYLNFKMERFSKKVKRNMGIIREDSELGKKVEMYANDLFNVNKGNKPGIYPDESSIAFLTELHNLSNLLFDYKACFIHDRRLMKESDINDILNKFSD